ncbi:MAG: kynureninase, partial [Pseudomonadota bacterium]
YAISRALAERGCQTDFRTPSTVRFGLSPLFLRYQDVWHALEQLQTILETELFRAPRFSVRDTVT